MDYLTLRIIRNHVIMTKIKEMDAMVVMKIMEINYVVSALIEKNC